MINWNKWLEEKRLVNQEIKRTLQPAIEVPPYQMTKRALTAPAYPTHASKRGIHWSASCYPVHANYEYHLDRMVEAGIGWVKYLSDGNGRPGAGDSGLQFGINVLSRGMVPIVRYYMDAGHKWTDANDYATEQNVAHGILMIETINEPDLNYEWADGKLPQDWAERSFTNWIEHAQRIIAHGGVPLSPSLASGFMQARGEGAGQLMLNPFKLVKAAGVERFVCGIHNYPLNHPIDYPYDDVNQKGTSLTQAEYERVGGSYAWDSQSIEQINAWRESDKNPGDGIYDDDSCFNAVEIFIDMLNAAGLPDVPIFTTEGGPCLTDRHDRRYPRVTPVVQEDMVADELQAMARNHRYMGYAWWLWGNNSVGGTGGWMTNQWYWPGGPFSDSNGFIPEFQYLKDHKVSDDGNDDDGDDDGNDGEDDNNDGGDDYVEPETDNQAINYGVVVDHPDVEEGKPYWKCILVKHYPPCENQGKHHVYMDAIDEDGNRVNGQTLLVNDIPVVIDKP
ncbi:MAG: hypothetical protein GX421_11820, partial [Caldisericales bacterium]|nr:hypothetical protein [Caldisericales bacterium]